MLCLAMVFVAVASLVSCGEDQLFNKELYRYFIQTTYPVDTLESDHPWTLLKRHHVAVTANINDSDIRELRIYDADPNLGDGSQLVGQSDITTGVTATVAYDMAQTATNTMYAALVTSDGITYVMPFALGQESVRFTKSQTKTLKSMPKTSNQTFTYLFESSFPTPEDFDYNDVVLRISRFAPRSNNLQITVTLAAAGCSKQVAAAIRLPGVSYDQVQLVNIMEKKSFDNDYPYNLRKINDTGNLVRGRNGDAVIRLFEDAHWSMMHEKEETGVILYKPCNTKHYEGSDTVEQVPLQTRTFNIYFKEGANADSLRLADLDPFIIESNTAINFEVHTYRYKFEEVLWEYLGGDGKTYDDYLAWALLIPDADFRYPLETVPLGYFRNGELYGAYGLINHSFGQWGRNYKVAQDWWHHPNRTLVY